MIHLRLIVPSDAADDVVERLRTWPGLAHLVRLPGAAVVPAGEVVLCEVSREVANDVVEWLQSRGVHHRGAIVIEEAHGIVSDAAAAAEAAAAGDGADALIWEQIEAQVRPDSRANVSYLLFIVLAAVIALVALLTDSPVLLVAAMAVGPDYGPIAAACVALARGRLRSAGRSLATLGSGLGLAVIAAAVATVLFRVADLAPAHYDVTSRQLTSFVARPDGYAAVVALLAGIAGMLALTQARSGALVGVLVAVTTIPAAANMGGASAYGRWSEAGGATLQLGVNVAGLLVAGVVTLWVQDRLARRRSRASADGPMDRA